MRPHFRRVIVPALGLVVAVAAVAPAAVAAPAFQPPALVQPLQPASAPPPPVGPTGIALGNAFRALGAAQTTNPDAARLARFALAEALARYRAGDFAAARAEAARAMALASAPVATPIAPDPPANR